MGDVGKDYLWLNLGFILFCKHNLFTLIYIQNCCCNRDIYILVFKLIKINKNYKPFNNLIVALRCPINISLSAIKCNKKDNKYS